MNKTAQERFIRSIIRNNYLPKDSHWIDDLISMLGTRRIRIQTARDLEKHMMKCFFKDSGLNINKMDIADRNKMIEVLNYKKLNSTPALRMMCGFGYKTCKVLPVKFLAVGDGISVSYLVTHKGDYYYDSFTFPKRMNISRAINITLIGVSIQSEICDRIDKNDLEKITLTKANRILEAGAYVK